MRGLFAAVLLMVCLSVISIAQAQAPLPWTDATNQIRNNTGTGLGARSLGMGGAYTAVADGPTAVYWNPAGLAWSEGLRTDFSITGQVDGLDVVKDAKDLYDSIRRLNDNPTLPDYEELYSQAGILSGRPVITDFSAAFLSLSYDNIGFGVWAQSAGGADLNVSTTGAFNPAVPSSVRTRGDALGYATAGLGYGYKMRPNFGVGISARYIQAARARANFRAAYIPPGGAVDGTTEAAATTDARIVITPDHPTSGSSDNSIGVDLGLIWEPQPELYDGRVRLAAMVRNINSPAFAIGPAGADVTFDPTVNVGMAVKSPNARALFALDIHNLTGANDNSAQFCAGIEYELTNWLTLRAGSLDGTFTKGLSARLGALKLSAAIGSSWDELAALSVDWDF